MIENLILDEGSFHGVFITDNGKKEPKDPEGKSRGVWSTRSWRKVFSGMELDCLSNPQREMFHKLPIC
jgi:hypothetical protein